VSGRHRNRLVQATAENIQERRRRRIRDIQELPGQTELRPVDRRGRGDGRGLARSRTEAKQDPREMLQPVRTGEASSESILQPSVHALHQPVGLRVEGSSEGVAEVEGGGQSRPDRGGKLRASVRRYLCRNTKARNPAV